MNDETMWKTCRGNGTQMLTEQEEANLFTAHVAGDKRATKALIDAHMPMIDRMVRRYCRRPQDADDMAQEGRAGMLTALNRFEPEQGFRISTYARWWIRAALLDWQQANHSPVRLGGTTADKRLFSGLGRAKRRLGILDDRMTTADRERIAHDLGVTAGDVERMETRLGTGAIQSVDAPMSGDGGRGTIGDFLADPQQGVELTAERIDEQRRSDALREAVARLDPRSRDVIERRYLIGEVETLREVSVTYGVSHERIRQIEAKAIADLMGMLPAGLIHGREPPRAAHA